jgi:hypothetical protein
MLLLPSELALKSALQLVNAFKCTTTFGDKKTMRRNFSKSREATNF